MKGLIVSATALLLFDQWSKRMVQGLASDLYFSRVPFLQIRRVVNLKRIYRTRYARPIMVVAWITAAASARILTRMGFWFHGEVAKVGLGLAFGGALGNLLDVIRLKAVVDFIDLRWWPVFNVADIGIVAGLMLAFWP